MTELVYAVQCITFPGKPEDRVTSPPTQELVGVALDQSSAFGMAVEHLMANSSDQFFAFTEPTPLDKAGWWAVYIHHGLYYRIIATEPGQVIQYKSEDDVSDYGNCIRCGRYLGQYDVQHSDGYGDVECYECLRDSNS